MKKSENNSILGKIIILMGVGFIIGAIVTAAYLGQKEPRAGIAMTIPIEPCIYQTKELMYVGDCYVATDLLDMFERRTNLEKLEEEIIARAEDMSDERFKMKCIDYLDESINKLG